MLSNPMVISTFQVIIAATDCLDDELGDGEEALEGDAEILGAEHAVTTGREEGGQRVIVRLRIWIKYFLRETSLQAILRSSSQYLRWKTTWF